MSSSSARTRLITIAASALLAACLQTPQPIPPGHVNDASTDAAEDWAVEPVTDAPGLDAYDDAAADPVTEIAMDPVDEPLTDADIGDPSADVSEEAGEDVEEDVEEDAEEDAEEDGPDVT